MTNSPRNVVRISLAFLAKGVISALFLWAGWIKVIDPMTFATSIQGYQLIPDMVIVWMAWFLPWLEIWCALALWAPAMFRKASWVLIIGMLLVFTVAKSSAVLRGLDISCGCTSSSSPMTWWSVAENLGWIALSAAAVALDSRLRTTS